MSGDINVFGGFVSGASSAVWGDIKGNIEEQTDLITRLNAKEDKQEGKGLSTNDYTDDDKEKLGKVNTVSILSLLPEDWVYSSADSMYKQEKSMANISESDTVEAYLSLSSNEEIAEKETLYWSKVEKMVTNNGSITTFIKNDSAPDITLNIKIKL